MHSLGVSQRLSLFSLMLEVHWLVACSCHSLDTSYQVSLGLSLYGPRISYFLWFLSAGEGTKHWALDVSSPFLPCLWGTSARRTSQLSWMRINLPRHDLLGEERWPVSQRRKVLNIYVPAFLLTSAHTEIHSMHIKFINQCSKNYSHEKLA